MALANSSRAAGSMSSWRVDWPVPGMRAEGSVAYSGAGYAGSMTYIRACWGSMSGGYAGGIPGIGGAPGAGIAPGPGWLKGSIIGTDYTTNWFLCKPRVRRRPGLTVPSDVVDRVLEVAGRSEERRVG